MELVQYLYGLWLSCNLAELTVFWCFCSSLGESIWTCWMCTRSWVKTLVQLLPSMGKGSQNSPSLSPCGLWRRRPWSSFLAGCPGLRITHWCWITSFPRCWRLFSSITRFVLVASRTWREDVWDLALSISIRAFEPNLPVVCKNCICIWWLYINLYKVYIQWLRHTCYILLISLQRTGVPSAREPEVLSTMATIVNKLESHITLQVPQIFDAVFECTLSMINKDFEEFPEHRTNFFLLLQVSIFLQ